MKTNIVVKLQVEGMHRWLGCNIIEVMFLKSYHRHIFHIRCELAVIDLDREVEIIKLKREIQDYLKRNYFDESLGMCDFKGMSCEQIGQDLLLAYNLHSCEVLEDNENGSITYSG